jgi:hypothetical protein
MRRAVLTALMCAVVCAARGNAQQRVSVSGSPATLAIRSAPAAGLPPASVSDASTTYSIRPAFFTSLKLTAQLNANMPSGVTLTVSMPATPNSVSNGPVQLSTTPRDVITGIDWFFGTSTHAITYSLSATTDAGVVPLQSRTVTLTLVAAP